MGVGGQNKWLIKEYVTIIEPSSLSRKALNIFLSGSCVLCHRKALNKKPFFGLLKKRVS